MIKSCYGAVLLISVGEHKDPLLIKFNNKTTHFFGFPYETRYI